MISGATFPLFLAWNDGFVAVLLCCGVGRYVRSIYIYCQAMQAAVGAPIGVVVLVLVG